MKFIHFFTLLFSCLFASAQVGPYSWQDHTSFNTCNSVCKNGNNVYASNYNGLVKVNINEQETKRINKITGLSDVGIRIVRSNDAGKVMVVYENCNIDILNDEDHVSNYPDLKLKTFNGKKIINEVLFAGNFAYLSCGFGIILFDLNKLEVKDTYIIGPGGNNLEIYQVSIQDSLIFAATPLGLFKANHQTSILNNFNNWKLVPQLPAGPYCGVINVSGKVLTAYSPFKTNNNISNKDTVYVYENQQWSKYGPLTGLTPVRKFGYGKGNIFTILGQFGPQTWDISGSLINYITTFNGNPANISEQVFEFDNTTSRSYFAADEWNGFYQTYGYHPFYPQNRYNIDGTNKRFISNIDVFEGKVAISTSYPDDGGGTNYSQEGYNFYKEGDWNYFQHKENGTKPILDINRVLFDRKDRTKMWASSWFNGLMEIKDNQLVAVYNASNTSMGEAYPEASRCSGLSMDEDGNLWLANSDTPKFLTCRKKDGTFVSFTFDNPRFIRKIHADKNNMIWILHERDQGLTVYRNTNFAQPQLNVNYKLINKDVGTGNLGANGVFSIAEDKDGKIWIGTSAGIRVFYNPTNIFSNSDYDAQPIKIVQDGNVELLLDKETVTSICVDGANNKWVGTQSGGLYCFSPDGLKELFHFTTENSPLYSNNILDVAYDEKSGDVFIGSILGLQSFRSPVIEGDDNYNEVYAFPNPVKPNYYGKVFVRGLVDNSVVKITDESGNLVWETKSQGGQIEWPVKNFAGMRAATGVYIVYAATTNGELRALTKILVVN